MTSLTSVMSWSPTACLPALGLGTAPLAGAQGTTPSNAVHPLPGCITTLRHPRWFPRPPDQIYTHAGRCQLPWTLACCFRTARRHMPIRVCYPGWPHPRLDWMRDTTSMLVRLVHGTIPRQQPPPTLIGSIGTSSTLDLSILPRHLRFPIRPLCHRRRCTTRRSGPRIDPRTQNPRHSSLHRLSTLKICNRRSGIQWMTSSFNLFLSWRKPNSFMFGTLEIILYLKTVMASLEHILSDYTCNHSHMYAD